MEAIKFKEMQKVILAGSRYKCGNCGENHGKYLYGAKIEVIPFKTKGKVVGVDENAEKIKVRLNNGGEYECHPDELELNRVLMQALAGTENLEGHPLLDMAQNSTIILVGDRVYTIGDEIKREERENAKDYVRVEGDSGRVKKTRRRNRAGGIWLAWN